MVDSCLLKSMTFCLIAAVSAGVCMRLGMAWPTQMVVLGNFVRQMSVSSLTCFMVLSTLKSARVFETACTTNIVGVSLHVFNHSMAPGSVLLFSLTIR